MLTALAPLEQDRITVVIVLPQLNNTAILRRTRNVCAARIEAEGLPEPPKSSFFLCIGMTL
ncbi:MAG: hypothetical protein H0X36_01510 [Sphingomonadaceae bacterium]|nr:hypothetical protein [Sphingomonadaceae bacterium]